MRARLKPGAQSCDRSRGSNQQDKQDILMSLVDWCRNELLLIKREGNTTVAAFSFHLSLEIFPGLKHYCCILLIQSSNGPGNVTHFVSCSSPQTQFCFLLQQGLSLRKICAGKKQKTQKIGSVLEGCLLLLSPRQCLR